jgi:hypothetical protein
MLRIFERPLSEVSGQDFNNFYNSFWNVIITMTTVGYGDVYPSSIGGRILGIFMCIWGVLLVSLFVVTISEQLELTQLQKNAYVLIQRLVYKDALKKVSASALFSMFKLGKAWKGKRENENGKSFQKILKIAENNFKRKMLMFNNKSSEMRKFDNTTELTYLSKNLIAFSDDIVEFKGKQDELYKQQDEVFNLLRKLLESKGVDFDEFLNKLDINEEDKSEKDSEKNTTVDEKD